jgi:hypothetical protein
MKATATKAAPTEARTKTQTEAPASHERLIQDLIETRGRPLVTALEESGILEWLDEHQTGVTRAQITARLRRLPPAVLHRSRAHWHRRQREGPRHRCAQCAVR